MSIRKVMRQVWHSVAILFRYPEYRIERDGLHARLICTDCDEVVESWPHTMMTDDEIWEVVRNTRTEAERRWRAR